MQQANKCSHLPGLHSRAGLRPHPVCCPHPAAPLGYQSAADPRCHPLLLQLLLLCLPLTAVQAAALQAVRGCVPQALLLFWEHWSPVNSQHIIMGTGTKGQWTHGLKALSQTAGPFQILTML
jgi:hypothetical protein